MQIIKPHVVLPENVEREITRPRDFHEYEDGKIGKWEYIFDRQSLLETWLATKPSVSRATFFRGIFGRLTEVKKARFDWVEVGGGPWAYALYMDLCVEDLGECSWGFYSKHQTIDFLASMNIPRPSEFSDYLTQQFRNKLFYSIIS